MKNLIKKTKGGFFSPVDEKHQMGGLRFSKWVMNFSRIGTFLLLGSFMVLMAIFQGPKTGDWGGEWVFYLVEGFIFLIWVLLIFKTLQHWNDLKNGTSR